MRLVTSVTTEILLLVSLRSARIIISNNTAGFNSVSAERGPTGATPRSGLGWICAPHFCLRVFLGVIQIRCFFCFRELDSPTRDPWILLRAPPPDPL